MSHPVTGARLIECTVVVLNIEERSAKEVFALVLDKFFCGERCEKTLQLLEEM